VTPAAATGVAAMVMPIGFTMVMVFMTMCVIMFVVV
jgi:hypothetical protein